MSVHAGIRIIKGPDRHRGIGSQRSDTHASAIRITAGPLSCYEGATGKPAPEVDNNGEAMMANPSNKLDGATFYLSEKCDVDDEFYCSDGSFGKIKDRSAAVLKADSLRFQSRAGGIKFMSSVDEYDTKSSNDGIANIDFIADNNNDGLQPLVLGDSLKKFLCGTLEDTEGMYSEGLLRLIDDIVTQISNLTLACQLMNQAMAGHVHIVPPSPVTTPGMPGIYSAPLPTPFGATMSVSAFTAPGMTDPCVQCVAAGLAASISLGKIGANMSGIKNLNIPGLKFNYLIDPGQPKYLFSANVRST
jgi:hypothetical protein